MQITNTELWMLSRHLQMFLFCQWAKKCLQAPSEDANCSRPPEFNDVDKWICLDLLVWPEHEHLGMEHQPKGQPFQLKSLFLAPTDAYDTTTGKLHKSPL